MRAATFIAAALPIGISALPSPAMVEDRGLLNLAICLPYNIVVNNLLQDPVLVPFCSSYTKISASTVTSVVGKAGGVVTVTSPVTVNGGGAVTFTNIATATGVAAAAKDVTSIVTATVTVPTATNAATCLASAYAAPTKVKRGLEFIHLTTTAAPAPAANARKASGKATRPRKDGPIRGELPVYHTAALPWKRDESSVLSGRFFNMLGGLFGGNTAPAPASAPAPAPAPATGPIGGILGGLTGGLLGGSPAPAPAVAPAPVAPALVKSVAGAVAPIASSVVRPAYLVGYSDDILQIICQCANIPAQVTTVTSTGVASTVTVAPTTTINAATSVTITKTTTVTPAAAGAKTVTSTTTSTVGSTATSIVPNGLVYKKFPSPFIGYSANAGFTSNQFKSKTPDFTGVWNNLNFATPYWPSMQVDFTLQLDQAAPFDVTQAALLFEGFFIAPQSGTYTFTVPAEYNDNFAELWTGDAALSWVDNAAAFKAIRTSTTSTYGTTSVTLNAGDAMPFTYLWANGGGAARSAFNIVFPDGSSPTDFSSLFVQPCATSAFSS